MTATTRRRTTDAAPPAADWRTQAACAGMDGDLFFPVGTSGPALTQTAEAKQVCLGCPVRSACLSWALETHQHGIWGGLTEHERESLRRRKTPRTRAALVEKALKLARPAVATVLNRYWQVEQLRNAGWGRRRLAADLGVSAESVVAAERLVDEVGSVEAALGSLAVAA